MSRPARARGLKHKVIGPTHQKTVRVAPRAGAWIETATADGSDGSAESRAPRGRVD